MQICKATIKDAEALLPLYEDIGYPTTASNLARCLEIILSQPHYSYLLAERNGEILGFLGYAKLFFFEVAASYYRILALSVAKEVRRQGIANKLINKLKKQAVKEGIKVLALNSGLTAKRNVAHWFYQAVGFEKVTAGFALYLKSQHK